ncbi:type II toxin-antitoxin system YafQ family toxin [Haemophilus influenzae]|nr:type II toxin-antitoxin system YafQ family toxin [Haemophilus influenzae]MCK8916194.1 type II toxin-antitoxin system YafQ family toxin [Haemophilus influenzae]MCK8957017.1 type II toxin-antitoxin system YafQ family toxin [Haemophilus influenzae]MCK9147135.1 type II toxin-antitoxin system YafQ family toxin [Haemophilus influenzae]
MNSLPLPVKYKDHALTGNWKGWRDCHIKNDLVLIYKIVGDEIRLARLNTHSEIFG